MRYCSSIRELLCATQDVCLEHPRLARTSTGIGVSFVLVSMDGRWAQ